MKTSLLTLAACVVLALMPNANASPRSAKDSSEQIAAMCRDKETRAMMLRELTSTRERKMEAVRMLKDDPEFRAMYDTGGLNRS